VNDQQAYLDRLGESLSGRMDVGFAELRGDVRELKAEFIGEDRQLAQSIATLTSIVEQHSQRIAENTDGLAAQRDRHGIDVVGVRADCNRDVAAVRFDLNRSLSAVSKEIADVGDDVAAVRNQMRGLALAWKGLLAVGGATALVIGIVQSAQTVGGA
jgi:uncharacterized protein YukE